MKFRMNIEIERIRKKLSKHEISQLLHISSSSYTRYINGFPMPASVLFKLSELLEKSCDYLLDTDAV